MDNNRIPRPGDIYNHFKDKPYQIITVATHTETKEQMVVYQALYGDYKTYVRPLEMFLSEVDHEKYPEAKQNYRFELKTTEKEPVKETEEATIKAAPAKAVPTNAVPTATEEENPMKIPDDKIILHTSDGEVNMLLLKFLDADSYTKKLEILTSNRKHMDDRLINDMAVSLDCAVDEGPLDQRISGLINCLQQMRRFEDRRLR
jgi:hypothetical protein